MRGAGAALLLGLAAAADAQPPPVADEPAAAVVTEVHASGEIDLGRVASDPAYAQRLLGWIDGLAAPAPAGAAQAAPLRGLRALILAAMGRREESAAIVDAIAAGRFADLSAYDHALRAAAMLQDPRRIVALLEAAARYVPAAEREPLRQLPAAGIMETIEQLDRQNDQQALTRFYETLVGIDWPADNDPNLRDMIRMSLIDARLERGDRAGAAALAGRIGAPARFLRLVVLRRYDGLFPDGADRPALVRRMFEENDRTTARALAARPADIRTILNRVEYLQSVGRAEAALALLQPYLDDVAATANLDPQGMWLIEYGAFALLALGRADEAVAAYARLAALPVPPQPGVPGPLLNHPTFLWQAGRHGEALALAQRLVGEADPRLNDAERATIWSAMACALAGLGRPAESRPWLERLETVRDANPVALMRAYLCAGDLAGAERLTLYRLASGNAESAVMGLQDWQRPEAPGEPAASIEARVAELRGRPAVAEALARTGHVLVLPASRTYWGGF